ncbi:uncharacterized protein LOC127130159 [Lathyrus oleraceus]|uniref:uncharacterized protein LOC127130159 n=1 Tax=Pisum sativum TaxID=3888 RepID=UPI0021D25AD5|nr:uncharacterized protein LOC127130159 [Pisum sativum]
MEQLEQNLAALREEIESMKGSVEGMKDKIDQLMRIITNMMARDSEANNRKNVSTSVLTPVNGNTLYGFISDIQGTGVDITQPKINFPLPKGSLPILVQNRAPCPTQIPVPHENYIDLSQKYEDEDPRYMVQENKPVTANGEPRVDNKYKILKESLGVVEGFNIFGINVVEMCLVLDVVIPPKFKTSEFEKYKGVSFPRNHLRMSVRKMAAYAENEKLIMHYFQDRLSKASLDLYMHLERIHVKSWEDLANTFIK